jgi:hypothetical protein
MLHEYHIIYSVRYYPWFLVTAVGLGTYYHGYGGTAVRTLIYFNKKACHHSSTVLLRNEFFMQVAAQFIKGQGHVSLDCTGATSYTVQPGPRTIIKGSSNICKEVSVLGGRSSHCVLPVIPCQVNQIFNIQIPE